VAARKIQNTFISGEISPKALGRTDLEKYYKGLLQAENYILMNLGGADSRPGWQYVALTKYQDGRNTRLKVMYSTAGDAYLLEFGDLYMRVHYDGAYFGVEIATPYSHEHVFDLHFAQIGDILYIAHGSYPVRQLRNQGGQFFLSQTRFSPPPSEPISIYPASEVTPGAVTGTGVTFTLGTASMVGDANVTQRLSHDNGPGIAIIVSITDTTHFVADIIEDFANLNPMASGNWHLSGPFDATLTIAATEVSPAGKIVTWTANKTPFTADMVGMFIKALGGQARITKVPSSPGNDVTVEILTELTATTFPAVVGAGAWTVESSAWASSFPNSVFFHDDRLGFLKDFTVDLSRTDDFTNFASGANDADAIRKTMASGDVIPTGKWAVSGEELFIGTDIREMKLVGGEVGVTPSASRPVPITEMGSSDLQAIKLDGSVIFAGAGRDCVNEVQFDFQSGGQVGRDLTFLAEHIPKGNIVQIVRQRAPHRQVWCVNGEKQLCGLKLNYVEQILAWQRVKIGGEILSAEVAPQFIKTGSAVRRAPWEEIYAVTKRVLNGATRYMIERMDFCAIDYPKQVTEGILCETDCAVTLNSPVEVSTIQADHLIGERVQINVDGIAQTDPTGYLVPDTGTVALSPGGRVIDVGLHFNAILETVPPDFPGAGLMAMTKRWIDPGVKLYRTASVMINGERIDATRAGSTVVVEPLTGRMTGDVKVTNTGYSPTQTIICERDRAVHSTILAVFGDVDIGK
jgi:hypothetical protein